jgi:hypothetical protein
VDWTLHGAASIASLTIMVENRLTFLLPAGRTDVVFIELGNHNKEG